MNQLDGIYSAERLRLRSAVASAVAEVWAQDHGNREAMIERSLAIVEAGQARTVALVDAYMTATMRRATGQGEPKGLDPAAYTVDKLRGAPAHDVYGRPFGALGAFIEREGEQGFETGMSAGRSSLERLATTDLQLAQTYSARDWMVESKQIRGYHRVLGPGVDHCNLCIEAGPGNDTQQPRLYHRGDLMPIHEHCTCMVVPVYGEVTVPFTPANFRTSGVRVEHDPEIGPRLLDPSWAG